MPTPIAIPYDAKHGNASVSHYAARPKTSRYSALTMFAPVLSNRLSLAWRKLLAAPLPRRKSISPINQMTVGLTQPISGPNGRENAGLVERRVKR
jgi:hypothetical protein